MNKLIVFYLDLFFFTFTAFNILDQGHQWWTGTKYVYLSTVSTFGGIWDLLEYFFLPHYF